MCPRDRIKLIEVIGIISVKPRCAAIVGEEAVKAKAQIEREDDVASRASLYAELARAILPVSAPDGRRRCKRASGYHRQGRAENTFFRYTSIIGEGLRARSPAGQGSEAVLGCEILNRMTDLGRPVSSRLSR